VRDRTRQARARVQIKNPEPTGPKKVWVKAREEALEQLTRTKPATPPPRTWLPPA
jgi:hypothetical protein